MAKKLGLALSAGAARGWAHVGVLRGLNELGLKPDVIAGTSVGALVGGAHLVGALDGFEAWARTLSPLSAFQQFTFNLTSGGLINAEAAFTAFEDFDRPIESLDVAFGAIACDLGTGEEVAITSGSLLQAVKASSAIPIVLNAVPWGDRWLVDGAVVNPTPISLARDLGADYVIAVDLNAVPRTLERFDPPENTLPVPVETSGPAPTTLTGAVTRLINDTRDTLSLEFQKAKARINAKPHLFETGMAVADTVQMQIARARMATCPPDLLLMPDMRAAMPNAFDRADEFVDIGRDALLAHADDIMANLNDGPGDG
ncbi:MAG: patatin-like phospholipase family protein [Pseudomonadota bacterium]